MTNLTEIAEEVARRVGSSSDEAWGFIDEAAKLIAERLDQGEDISIRGVGTLTWVSVPARKLYNFQERKIGRVEPGYKLRFIPHGPFITRRKEPDERRPRRPRDDKAGSRSR